MPLAWCNCLLRCRATPHLGLRLLTLPTLLSLLPLNLRSAGLQLRILLAADGLRPNKGNGQDLASTATSVADGAGVTATGKIEIAVTEGTNCWGTGRKGQDLHQQSSSLCYYRAAQERCTERAASIVVGAIYAESTAISTSGLPDASNKAGTAIHIPSC